MEIQLSDTDKRKITRQQTYVTYKKISAAKEQYKHFEIGTALFIKRIGEDYYVTKGGWRNPKKPPIKFVIIENDDGFIFAKKVLASGELGADITCLTTDYGPDRWELVPDDAMVDAMLLDEEYDPTADAKSTKKKKSRASNINNKHRKNFKSAKDAYNFLENLTVGQRIWVADTTFGENIAEFEVIKAELTPTISYLQNGYRARRIYQYHTSERFDSVLSVVIRQVSGKLGSTMQTVHFFDITNSKQYRSKSRLFYTKKPISYKEINL